MSDLIEALQIFLKYGDSKWPTYCEHDVLHIQDIDPAKVSDADIKRLDELGFFVNSEDAFSSFKFGS